MRLIDADALKELFSEVIGHIAKKPEMNGNLEHMIRASAMVIQMIDDAPTVQPDTTTHDSIPAKTGKNDGDGISGDCISRQQAIDALKSRKTAEQSSAGIMRNAVVDFCIGIVKKLPSAQPVAKKIGYAECANAMLKMWIDNVLTDGEYNRIMDKLNAHYDAERRQK